MIKRPGDNQPSYPLYTTEANPNSRRLNPEIPPDLRASLGESALDQATTLQQERDKNLREIVSKKETKLVSTGGSSSGGARTSTRPEKTFVIN